MSYQIINIATKEDLELIERFVNDIKFNTKEDHISLHDPLFSQDGINFDIVTYGDMSKDIVDVFKKYIYEIKKAVTEISKIEYGIPILGKSYILRYTSGKELPFGYSENRPKNTYRSVVIWNDNYVGGNFKFKNYKIAKKILPGDCIIFPDNEEFSWGLSKIDSGSVFLSDFWNAPVGQSPYPGLRYEDIYWGNPLWENA